MLTSFTEGVWYDTAPVRIVGTRLTSTMTVLRLGAEDLVLVSPLAMTPERRAEVTALGRVAHLYAPNAFHHLWIGEWSAAFPAARLHAPSALASKRRDLRIDRFHDETSEPDFAGVVDEVPIRGFRLAETVLVYRPSRTAIVTDLVHNIGQPADRWTKVYTSLMGFYDRVALSRMLRWTAFADRGAARESIDEVLRHSFDGLVVGHGSPIQSHGREVLAQATSWLPPRSGLVKAVRRRPLLFGKPCG